MSSTEPAGISNVPNNQCHKCGKADVALSLVEGADTPLWVCARCTALEIALASAHVEAHVFFGA